MNALQSLALKPKKRHPIRAHAGKLYYRSKKHLEWIKNNQSYAHTLHPEPLQHQVFTHKSKLYRQLRDVDMWYQDNKVHNLSIAIKQLNGLILKPGETFSYWKVIGNPSKRKGYIPGMILFHGSFKPGVGGGLCQLSNLIYWMTLHTPLTVLERHRHSYDVFPDTNRKQPFGSGATCAYNFLDLQLQNMTDVSYQLNLWLTDEHLVGEWRSTHAPLTSYQVYEKEHAITHEHWGAYVRHNKIHRRVYNYQQEEIDDEYVTENHALMMYDPLLENNFNQ
ncbi:VanW family protein [Pontibacillus marinus]|uniref:Vancomycin B-type resistance protein n=1 Tax=Pontibacillus marinus BH030004 = DSM 16465 TaxID=1385511 RepID=A0A0A5GB03_9BACI|nr:VanW family protein [Pontibacillus marinus]KGX90346.1 vancomycin B-type resistance protein [Pontibacillus marinus BH030004 = DSM 16465]